MKNPGERKRRLARGVVLIVDDDPTIRSACQRSLRHVGQVIVAADASTAQRLAQVVFPDLAIIDLRLGEESGIPLIRWLRKRSPSIRIALIAGVLSIADAVAAMKAGADVVLEKPVHPGEILRRLADDRKIELRPSRTASIDRVEWQHIHGALADANGNVTHAAARLGILRTSLQRRLRKPLPPV